jgi:glycosyltransferase involved in cell wall biosynthesis
VKNHDAIFKALANVSHDLNFRYLHIGEEESGQPEREIAKELGIYDRVEFLGFITDVLPALHAADLFIMPSLREGFGIAALEAMGSGVSVLLAESPGLKDFAEIDGIFWARTEAESLAVKIKSVEEIPLEERIRRGAQVQKFVVDKYGIRAGVLAYLEIYRGDSIS